MTWRGWWRWQQPVVWEEVSGLVWKRVWWGPGCGLLERLRPLTTQTGPVHLIPLTTVEAWGVMGNGSVHPVEQTSPLSVRKVMALMWQLDRYKTFISSNQEQTWVMSLILLMLRSTVLFTNLTTFRRLTLQRNSLAQSKGNMRIQPASIKLCHIIIISPLYNYTKWPFFSSNTW